MLTAAGCASRRDRLWAALPAPCDVLLVGDPSHLMYLAGYSPSPFVFRTVESAALLILQPGSSTLVADGMLGPFVDASFVDERVAPVWYDGQHSAPYRRGQLVESALIRLGTIPGTRVGVELASVPAGLVEGLRAARRISKSSTSVRSCVFYDEKRMPMRSRNYGGRCTPVKRVWALPKKKSAQV